MTLSDNVPDTADEFVQSFGCRRCQRRRRSTYARVLVFCPRCLGEGMHVGARTRGWASLRKEFAGYLTNTEAPWAVVQCGSGDVEAFDYYAPEWVVLALLAGSATRRIRTVPGAGVESSRAKGPCALPPWPDVITALARSRPLRNGFVALTALAEMTPGSRHTRAEQDAYAQAVTAFLVAHMDGVAPEGPDEGSEEHGKV